MAGVSSAVIGGLGLGLSAFQTIDGANRQKKAQRELNDYERQELDNAYKDMPISTMGSDLLREENARTSANLVDASQQAGSRAIIGAVPKIVGATNNINQEAAKLLDDQVQKRNYAIAGDNARIEGITENRDMANTNALSSQVQTGRQDMWNGMMGGADALAYFSRFRRTNPAVETIVNPNLNPAGIVNFPAPQINATLPNFSSIPYSSYPNY